MDYHEAMQLLAARSPSASREATKTIRRLAMRSPVAVQSAERVIAAGLADPQAELTDGERDELAALLTPKLYTAEQLADLLGIKPVTVRLWSRRLGLGFRPRPGERAERYYTDADLAKLRARHTVRGRPPDNQPSPAALYRRQRRANELPKLDPEAY